MIIVIDILITVLFYLSAGTFFPIIKYRKGQFCKIYHDHQLDNQRLFADFSNVLFEVCDVILAFKIFFTVLFPLLFTLCNFLSDVTSNKLKGAMQSWPFLNIIFSFKRRVLLKI